MTSAATRPRSLFGLVFLLSGALLLAGCAPIPTDAAPAPETGKATVPAADVVSAVATDPAIAATLPAEVRQAGKLRVGGQSGSPPIQFLAEGNKDLVGVEVDLRNAVAKVLGLTVDQEIITFDAILPALRSGKYHVGQGNFGVTEERKKTIDFVTYYDDGFGFLVRAGDPRPAVNDLADLCGLKVGTGTGTSFEQLLRTKAAECAAKGKPEYAVSTFADTAAGVLALAQSKFDIYVLTSLGLQYRANQQPTQLKFLNQIYTEHIGFALKKDSPLVGPLNKAVQKLIDDGSYRKILDKWGLAAAAISRSLVNPAGLS